MAGSLDYSLGLATTNFLGGINIARGALAGFIGFATGAGGLIAGVMSQISKGAGLKDLSARTGESVRDLYSLQNAFDIVGVQASNLPTILFTVQKALGGISEGGEPTDVAFRKIGLSMTELKKLDAPALLSAIAGGLAKVDRATASNVASKIAGRGGAADLLQIARDSEDFAAAIERAASGAALFERNAAAFDKLDDTFTELKQAAAGFFAGIAAGVTPPLQAVLDGLKGFDLEGLGRRIGSIFASIPQALQQGKVGKLVELTLTVAFEKAVNFLATSLAAVFAALPDLIKGSASAGASSIGVPIVGAVARFFAGDAAIQAKNAIPGSDFQAERERASLGWRLFAAAAEAAAPEEARKAAEKFVAAAQAAAGVRALDLFGGSNQAALADLVRQFAPPRTDIPSTPKGAGATNLIASGRVGDADALTRIGGFSGGGTSDLTTHARQTAENTREMFREVRTSNTILQKMLDRRFSLEHL